MSLSTRARPDRRAVRVIAFVLVMLGVQSLMATGAAAVPTSTAALPLPDVAVLPAADPRVSLVVNVGGDVQPVQPEAVSVTVGGARQPTAVEPVMSDELAVGIVIDASEAGADQLPAWLSGAARFVLEAPAAAQAAVVADTTPPLILAKLQQGPVNLVRTLSGVQPRGNRQTSEALSLAVDQLPATPTDKSGAGPRVIVMYTSAPDAGGEPAAHLGARLARAHVLLVVVSTAADTRYWSTAARATGGFLAPAGAPTVRPALDQVATMLRARYLVSFPAPSRRPTHASVRVNLQDVAMAADVVVPAAQNPPGSRPWQNVLLWVVVAVAVVTLGLGAVLRPR
jgi:hypothetical protein